MKHTRIQNSLIERFKSLPAREQLALFKAFADEFSFSHGHGDIMTGIDVIAEDLAQEEGWDGDDLSARYLDVNLPARLDRIAAGRAAA